MNPSPAASHGAWSVICLCAQWCGVCREWRGIFEEAAAAHPDVHFAWVDVEDEAHAMGEVDVETFPTLLIAQGSSPRFFGPVQPSGAQVARLIASLREGAAPLPEATAAAGLLARLAPIVLSNP